MKRKNVLITILIIVLLVGCYFIIYQRPTKQLDKVIIDDPELLANYPTAYRPIPFIEYSQKGKWSRKNDLPKNFFKTPYLLEEQEVSGDSWKLIFTGDILLNADVQITAFLKNKFRDRNIFWL